LAVRLVWFSSLSMVVLAVVFVSCLPILGFAPTGAPAAVWNAMRQSPVQRGTIRARLAARDDFDWVRRHVRRQLPLCDQCEAILADRRAARRYQSSIRER
jgi:hypothetical protein